MKGKSEIFVKLNYKNIGELNSFIYDKAVDIYNGKDKYVMCAGKYNKDGWTIVFKAKNIYEAEKLLEINSRKRQEFINLAVSINEKISNTYYI